MIVDRHTTARLTVTASCGDSIVGGCTHADPAAADSGRAMRDVGAIGVSRAHLSVGAPVWSRGGDTVREKRGERGEGGGAGVIRNR